MGRIQPNAMVCIRPARQVARWVPAEWGGAPPRRSPVLRSASERGTARMEAAHGRSPVAVSAITPAELAVLSRAVEVGSIVGAEIPVCTTTRPSPAGTTWWAVRERRFPRTPSSAKTRDFSRWATTADRRRRTCRSPAARCSIAATTRWTCSTTSADRGSREPMVHSPTSARSIGRARARSANHCVRRRASNSPFAGSMSLRPFVAMVGCAAPPADSVQARLAGRGASDRRQPERSTFTPRRKASKQHAGVSVSKVIR